MSDILDISWIQLSFAVIFIVILVGISLYESLKLEKSMLLGAFRSSIQLIIVGYLIQAIFEIDTWYIISLMLMIMLFVASQTLIKRIKNRVKGMYFYALIAVSLASLLTLFIISQVIVNVKPWYDPRYMIPLAGMIIANGMNGAALAGERYRSELTLRLNEIEMLLSLGYDIKKASLRVRQQALISALIPSVNNMMVMGIVHLPGMMTGQIIAGSNPVTAVKYQIVIILGIASTVALTSWIFLSLLQKKFFTPDHQIRYEVIQTK